MMSGIDWVEFAEMLGYVHCICSQCGQSFYTDGDPECPDCGAEEEEDE